MEKANESAKANLDKNFVARLKAILAAQGDKVDAQYLCSAPAPVRNKKRCNTISNA